MSCHVFVFRSKISPAAIGSNLTRMVTHSRSVRYLTDVIIMSPAPQTNITNTSLVTPVQHSQIMLNIFNPTHSLLVLQPNTVQDLFLLVAKVTQN